MNSRWQQVVRQDGSRRRSGSASAAHGHAPWAYVERLEERQLLTLSSVLITGTGTTITPAVGAPFVGIVASFSALPPGVPNNFVATIDWGDGSAPSAGTIQLDSPGQYNVLGSHLYTTLSAGTPSSPYQVSVTVVQAFSNGAPATVIKSQAVVQTPPFTGRLDPLSDTGVSNNDGITNINQPTFSGTAQPYSLIQIYSKLPQQLGPILQGSTVAGADGSWSLATGPLADGAYAISATVTPPGGAPVSSTALPPLVIDTVAPQVTGVVYSRAQGEFEIVFRDNASGMDLGGLLNSQNYNLIGHPQRRYASTTPPLITTIQIVPNDTQAVVLTLNQNYLRMGLRTLRVLSGGVADVAGNALAGAYRGSFPSGNGLGGTNFVMPLSKAQKTSFPAATMAVRQVRFSPSHRRGR